MIFIDLEQGSPEWLEYRRTRIGSSDAPVIMGESPWKTPYQLWQEKLSESHENKENFAMYRGKMLEERARSAYEVMKGEIFYPRVVQHREHSWKLASLDGLSYDAQRAVEIKCPGREDHDLALSGKIPPKYKAQLQHQIHVCKLDSIDYFSFDGESGVIVKEPRDPEYLLDLIKREREFFFNLQSKTPPAFTEKDYVDKNNDKIYEQKVKLWEEKEAIFLKAQEEKDLAKKDLIDYCKGENTKGFGIRIQRIIRKGTIMYENIPELREIDVEKYRKESVIYFKIVEEKTLPKVI
jgi:putative phage-type endonuclease